MRLANHREFVISSVKKHELWGSHREGKKRDSDLYVLLTVITVHVLQISSAPGCIKICAQDCRVQNQHGNIFFSKKICV